MPIFNEWNTAADDVAKELAFWNVSKADKNEALVKEVFIEELPIPKICDFDINCSIDELMHRVVMTQAYYCRRVQEILSQIHPSLMQLYSGENKKHCETYATLGTKSWKYLGAALTVGSAALPFCVPGGDAVKMASKGLAATGSASGGIGDTWDGHYRGQGAGHQHAESNYRRLIENTDRSTSNVYSSIEVLARMISEIVNRVHQSKVEMVR